jgi:hypothetical protein
MAQADCSICESLGYRSCDKCRNPVFEVRPHPRGLELCPACWPPGTSEE